MTQSHISALVVVASISPSALLPLLSPLSLSLSSLPSLPPLRCASARQICTERDHLPHRCLSLCCGLILFFVFFLIPSSSHVGSHAAVSTVSSNAMRAQAGFLTTLFLLLITHSFPCCWRVYVCMCSASASSST